MKRKGFTLIELLAVIIILGILMLIAIPSVTTYINNSRKNTYVDTIQEIIKGAVIRVNNGDLDMFDTNTTYYIPTSAIDLESGKMQSPYGKIENDAYVVVTYDGESYDYYFVGKDAADVGVGEITKKDNLSINSIQTDIGEIDTTVGIEGKEYVVVFTEDLEKGDAQLASRKVSGNGPAGQGSGNGSGSENANVTPLDVLCKRADLTTLHTTECGYYGCQYCEDFERDAMIIYGNTSVTNGVLRPGDAFDCDVNADNILNPDTERFYYLTDSENNNALLIYYSSVHNGEINNEEGTYYTNYGYPKDGPLTAYEDLPSTTQWSNQKLIAPGTRQIKNEYGGITINNYDDVYDLAMFTYTDKAARLATIQEITATCGVTPELDENLYYDFSKIDLSKNSYLLENTQFDSSTNEGYFLENPGENSYGIGGRVSHTGTWLVNGDTAELRDYAYYYGDYAARPVIEVRKTDIEY